MQTNGTLIDADWAAFLKEHEFLVGLSIDGPRDLHDAYRVNKGGKGSFTQVRRGLACLQEARVEWNALTTIHAANAEHGGEVYRFLRDDCGAQFIQFIPIIERVAAADEDGTVPWSSWRDRRLYRQEGTHVTNRSVTGRQYGRFLIDVFEEWVRRDVGEVYVQMFDVALANWVGEPPGLCIHSETCGLALELEHTGDLYSCDHFVEPRYPLGNIKEQHMLELVSSPQQRQFGLDKRETLPQYCLDCDVRFACHGGCPKDRFIETPDGEPRLNYLCSGYKEFFHHIDGPMRFMAEQLRRGEAPAQVMQVYAAEDARRGRNEVCTCGSGRKWKRCHGALAA
jgi:serine-type anaerobic sulfatase-maturating enzyme